MNCEYAFRSEVALSSWSKISMWRQNTHYWHAHRHLLEVTVKTKYYCLHSLNFTDTACLQELMIYTQRHKHKRCFKTTPAFVLHLETLSSREAPPPRYYKETIIILSFSFAQILNPELTWNWSWVKSSLTIIRSTHLVSPELSATLRSTAVYKINNKSYSSTCE